MQGLDSAVEEGLAAPARLVAARGYQIVSTFMHYDFAPIGPAPLRFRQARHVYGLAARVAGGRMLCELWRVVRLDTTPR
jgi:hypothetical protein